MRGAPHSSGKASALVSMMRLPNCVMIGFAVIVGEIIASPIVPVQIALNGFMTGFLLLASSMVLNDYFDREIDAINEPTRPMPAGKVKPSEAISFAIILASFGLVFAASTGTLTLGLAVVSMIIMLAYNARIKRLGRLGNAFVSTNVAIPFVYGGLAVGRPTWSLGIFAMLAFLSSMGREIMKGIVDVQGDSSRHVRTVAATHGNQRAAVEAAVLFLAAIALSALPILLGLVSMYYLPPVIICDVGFLLTAYSAVADPTPNNARRNKKYVLVWMTFGLLAFVVGVA